MSEDEAREEWITALTDAGKRALQVLEYLDADLVYDYTPKEKVDERREAIAGLRAVLEGK